MEKNFKNRLKRFDNCTLTNQDIFSAKHKAKFSSGATSESELKYSEIGAGVGFGF